MIKWIIFILFLSVVLFLLIFLFACMKISSECSGEEERRNAYNCIRNDSTKS